MISSLLSWKPAVGLGLVSYSLYLWHWPVLVLYRIQTGGEPSSLIAVTLFVLCLGLSWLSWRFIERPFRRSTVPALKSIFIGLSIMAGFTAITTTVARTEFLLPPAPEFGFTRAEMIQEQARYWENRPFAEVLPGRPDLVVMGDSHAVDLYYALYEQSLTNLTLIGYPFFCMDVIGSEPDKDVAKECEQAFQEILANPVLHAAEVIFLTERWLDGDHADLKEVVDRIKERNPNAEIVIVGPKPELAMQPEDIFAQLQEAVKELDVSYISLIGTICAPEGCGVLKGEKPTYFDTTHWSSTGAKMYGSELLQRSNILEIIRRAE